MFPLLRPHEFKQYEKFDFIYPPYQFQDKHRVVNPRGELCPPTDEMRDILMDFTRSCTHAVCTAADRRANSTGFVLARCSLLGNTFHSGVIAWLMSSRWYNYKILVRPVTVAEVAGVGTPIALGAKQSRVSWTKPC